MHMYRKDACTCQSYFWYLFEMTALLNLISRYLFLKKKQPCYLSNFCYTFEHQSILIFESIAKAKRICICI